MDNIIAHIALNSVTIIRNTEHHHTLKNTRKLIEDRIYLN